MCKVLCAYGFGENVCAYGFGENVCQWMRNCLKNIKSTVIVNGQVTVWFTVERGYRQGDPISPHLFILCAEILAIIIREDKDIKGICIHDTEYKLSQFADDTELMNKLRRISFEKSTELIDVVGKASGLYF